MRSLANIFWLGTKELRSFMRDYVLLGLVIYSLLARHHRAVAEQLAGAAQRLDRDRRRGSFGACRAASSTRFLPPYFKPPQPIAERDIDPLMNAGRFTFVLDIPPISSGTFWPVKGRRSSSTSTRRRWCRPASERLRPADHHQRRSRII